MTTIAIIGSGFLAHTRARCWKRVFGSPVEVVVAARDASRAAALAKEHGLDGACSLEEALSNPAVKLVDLCVPNRVHREFCEKAAASGKHVLCTKPLAISVEDAEAMCAACAKASVRLFYGENWCFAPAITRAERLCAASQGTIRELRGWESHSGSHAAASKDLREVGGGALLRLGSHAIGAMLWMKSREGMRLRGKPTRVKSVVAETAGDRGAPERWGSCMLTFDDDSVGVAIGSDNMLGGMESHLTVLASTHRLECSLSPIDTLRSYAPSEGTFGSEYIMEKVAGQAGWTTPIPDEDWSSGQQGLVQSVAEALASGAAPICDGALGVEVVRIIRAAYTSAAEGRRLNP